MSDQSGLVTMDNGLDLDVVRQKFLEGLGKSHLRKPHYMNSATLTLYTLAGDYDEGWADCTTAPATYKLPASPNDGDHYTLGKLDATANALTIDRNGKTINTVAANQTITAQLTPKRLTWVASLNTWVSV